MTKFETKCPFAPWPSNTPYNAELFITKFEMLVWESWLIFVLLSRTPAVLMVETLQIIDESG